MNAKPQSKRVTAAKLQAASRAKPQRRAKIARDLGISKGTLRRRIKIYRTEGRVDRKQRKDIGRPRVLSELWAALALQIFVSSASVTWRQIQQDVAARCSAKGLPAPSYSWIKRRVNFAFKRIMQGSRIRRLGNFVREDDS